MHFKRNFSDTIVSAHIIRAMLALAVLTAPAEAQQLDVTVYAHAVVLPSCTSRELPIILKQPSVILTTLPVQCNANIPVGLSWGFHAASVEVEQVTAEQMPMQSMSRRSEAILFAFPEETSQVSAKTELSIVASGEHTLFINF